MKVEVIALKRFGATKKGGHVWIPAQHAKLYVSIGLAEYAPVVPVAAAPVSKGTYQRRDMVAEPRAAKAGPVPGITSQSTKQTYKPRSDDGKA